MQGEKMQDNEWESGRGDAERRGEERREQGQDLDFWISVC